MHTSSTINTVGSLLLLMDLLSVLVMTDCDDVATVYTLDRAIHVTCHSLCLDLAKPFRELNLEPFYIALRLL